MKSKKNIIGIALNEKAANPVTVLAGCEYPDFTSQAETAQRAVSAESVLLLQIIKSSKVIKD